MKRYLTFLFYMFALNLKIFSLNCSMLKVKIQCVFRKITPHQKYFQLAMFRASRSMMEFRKAYGIRTYNGVKSILKERRKT